VNSEYLSGKLGDVHEFDRRYAIDRNSFRENYFVALVEITFF